MPGVYAHYRFGREMYLLLSAKQKQCVTRFRRLYDMGLYGPDIFDYWRPLLDTSAEVPEFHCYTGREFFTQALKQADSEGARAYLYGLLAHYCLDAQCGAFLGRTLAQGGSLAAIEEAFDGYLLAQDGLPVTYDRSQHMHLTRGESVTVSQFYPPMTSVQTHNSIWNMTRFYHLLSREPGGIWDNLRKLPWSARIGERKIGQVPAPEQLRRNSELLARYNRAGKAFPQLLHALEAGELGEEFDRPFRI